jgi:demethylmenaquinone methyltransferase/2-methoxy-6-polyprenyl-1,4-benzoquinol methylase
MAGWLRLQTTKARRHTRVELAVKPLKEAVADLSKKPERIAGMFDAIAPRYDFLNHLLSAGIDRHWRNRAIRSLRLTGCERVLDLCTGTADLAIAARQARPPAARVVGVDFAGAMLAIGAQKIRRAALGGGIVLARGDAMRIPVVDTSVDAVTIAFGIRNVEDPELALRDVARVLKPGGRLVVLEFAIPTTPVFRAVYLSYFRHILPRIGRAVSRHDAAYGYLPASVGAFASPDAFTSLLRNVGFRDVSADPMTFGSVYLYTARRG